MRWGALLVHSGHVDRRRSLKAFDALTPRGKARRLRQVAIEALTHYDLDVTRVELLGLFTNALFRVRVAGTSAGGATSYVMRLSSPGWRTDVDLRSEVMWLLALKEETDIGAPVPVAARTEGRLGRYLVEVATEDVPIPSRCMVMSWLPGVSLAERLSEATLGDMGALFARLHAHGVAFAPPEGFTQRKMSAYLARDEPQVLFDAIAEDGISPHACDVLRRADSVVKAAFAQRYADGEGLRVIHNDLWHDNIKIHRGRLRPLDFEDTIWGYPVQDIAMALQDLASAVTPPVYVRYVDALRAGYERLAPWPERYAGEIDRFRVGRMLWVANYVARVERVHLPDHVRWLTPQLERFLATGRLTMRSAPSGTQE